MQFPLGFGIGTSYPTGTNYIGGYGNPILNALITTWTSKVGKIMAQTLKNSQNGYYFTYFWDSGRVNVSGPRNLAARQESQELGFECAIS